MKTSIFLRNCARRGVSAKAGFLAVAVGLTLAAGVALWRWADWGAGSAAIPAPEEYPVRGIDVSAHNGDIDFGRVAADGIGFVMIKATEGHSFKDRNFTANYNGARAAGLRVGAYHFFRFDCTGYMQALNLLHSLRGRPLDLPVVIDVEEWTNPRDYTERDVMTRLASMVSVLESRGLRVMLYSNKEGFQRFLSERFAHYPLWLASMTGRPESRRLRLWQYSHRGRVDGVHGAVDMNVFCGSACDFADWLSPGAR